VVEAYCVSAITSIHEKSKNGKGVMITD